jgi:hypothetical protein
MRTLVVHTGQNLERIRILGLPDVGGRRAGGRRQGAISHPKNAVSPGYVEAASCMASAVWMVAAGMAYRPLP